MPSCPTPGETWWCWDPAAEWGPEMREMVRAALAASCAVVLDADALTSFCEQPEGLLGAIRTRPGGATLMTPHAGEFNRLFGTLPSISQAISKLEQARQAAAQSGAIVLLKGPDTVVAAPDGSRRHRGQCPALARDRRLRGCPGRVRGRTPGTGRAGLRGGSGSGMAPRCEAGREAGAGLISEDLPEVLPKIYRRLFADAR